MEPGPIEIETERSLLRAAQAGDRSAEAELLRLHEPQLARLCGRVVFNTGAVKDRADILQEGRLALTRRIHSYDFAFFDRARKADTKPGRKPAQLWSYAFRDVRAHMMRYACRNLEVVRIGASKTTYAAHRDLEQGMPEQDVAIKHRMTVETVRSLHRTTVELQDDSLIETETIEDRTAERERGADLLLFCWYGLSADERVILTLRNAVENVRARARLWGMSIEELVERETTVLTLVRRMAEAI